MKVDAERENMAGNKIQSQLPTTASMFVDAVSKILHLH